MADEFKNITEDDNGTEEMTLTLELDDGDIECSIVTIFECENQDYIALLPLDENGENTEGEVWIYRYFEDENDPNAEPVLEYIEDDEEFAKVEEAYDEFLDSTEYDEIIGEDED